MNSVIDGLITWGPDANPRRPPSLAESEEYCRRLARSHYENFPVVSWLLPRRLRQPFANVYAFCRWADDLGDETGDQQRSLELLAWWRGELERCFAGDVRHPVFVALRETAQSCGLPAQPFHDLISAFEQDQSVDRYETFDQLQGYCRRSSNPVGRLILHLCDNVTDETLKWSDSICTGLQLANFWQDISRDFAIGRVYLPSEDRRRFCYSDHDLENRQTNDAFLQLMRFEVDRAHQFLANGRPLVPTMSGRLQVVIEMFQRGGLQILSEIESIGYRVWNRRPVVSKPSMVIAFLNCIGRAAVRPGGLILPAMRHRG